MQPMIQEMEQESQSTRRLLELVPEEKLDWTPHPSSMTLGQLAMHIASTPGNVSALLSTDNFDAQTASFKPPQPTSTEEILAAFSKSLVDAKNVLSAWDQSRATSKWSLMNGA